LRLPEVPGDFSRLGALKEGLHRLSEFGTTRRPLTAGGQRGIRDVRASDG
jgi:hypothetical protein